MTLYLELYDSEPDDLLAKADPKYDRNSGYMQKGLDEAHAATKKKEE